MRYLQTHAHILAFYLQADGTEWTNKGKSDMKDHCQVSKQGCMSLFCASHDHLWPCHPWKMNYFGAKIHLLYTVNGPFRCVMFVSVRWHRNYHITPSLSFFLPAKPQINCDSNAMFWKCCAGLSAERMNTVSISPPLHRPLSLLIEQHTGREDSFFRWINHMCHHRRSCVWSAEGGARHGEKTWKG